MPPGLAIGETAIMFRAIGRSALIAAAGLCLCISGPARAVEGDGAGEKAQAESPAGAPVVLKKYTKRSKYSRRAHSRKSARAEKAADQRKKAAEDKSAQTDAEKNDSASETKPEAAPAVTAADVTTTGIPASVANANAQWIGSPQTAADIAARSMSTQADNVLRNAQADATPPQATDQISDNSAVIAPDQLNEVDRAVSAPGASPDVKPAVMATAQQDPRPAGQPAQAASQAASSDDSSWGQASLIGKIFIAFGGLLTLASAARMFIA